MSGLKNLLNHFLPHYQRSNDEWYANALLTAR